MPPATCIYLHALKDRLDAMLAREGATNWRRPVSASCRSGRGSISPVSPARIFSPIRRYWRRFQAGSLLRSPGPPEHLRPFPPGRGHIRGRSICPQERLNRRRNRKTSAAIGATVQEDEADKRLSWRHGETGRIYRDHSRRCRPNLSRGDAAQPPCALASRRRACGHRCGSDHGCGGQLYADGRRPSVAGGTRQARDQRHQSHDAAAAPDRVHRRFAPL